MRRPAFLFQLGGAIMAFTLAAMLALGAFGGWTDQDTAAQPVTFGTVNLLLNNSTLSTALGDATNPIAPTNTLYRYVDFANTGANALALKNVRTWAAFGSITDTISPTATATDLAGDIKVSVETCSVAWNQSTNTCGGSTTTILSQQYLSALDSSAEVKTLYASLPAGSTSYARFVFLIDDVADVSAALDGAGVTLTWTFVSDARDAVSSM